RWGWGAAAVSPYSIWRQVSALDRGAGGGRVLCGGHGARREASVASSVRRHRAAVGAVPQGNGATEGSLAGPAPSDRCGAPVALGEGCLRGPGGCRGSGVVTGTEDDGTSGPAPLKGCDEAFISAGDRESAKRIRLLNSSSKDNTTAFYGINQFSHLFPEEFKAIYLRSIPHKLPRYIKVPKGKEKPLPKKFDWRDKKVIAEVRNQQTCGGCWAFSVVGGIESAYAIKRSKLEELSVQQVIDCSYNNYGCSGGSTVSALNWLNQTKVKLVRDSEYTFKAQTGLCHYFGHSDFGVSITGFAAYDFSGQEEEMMRMLVNWGPLAVTVDAVSWQDYLGGIIQYHCSSGRANHAVLITGFDTTGNIPYWIVQNSWGPTWGIDGYVRVKIGSNVCGIADTVSSVFV
ncbi:PREDICTED: cathepsin O, partial [Mesitornis unicolor]|uniref:cathepsin O n=1 Tax=Mesitornis unicolor TaxID=54374 RepID=UPI00052812AA